jgi:CubicO group peptidase (beta-lactamase class C family)
MNREIRYRARIVLLLLATITLVPRPAPSQAQEAAARAEPRTIAAVLQPFVDRHELAGAVTLVAGRESVLAIDAVGFVDLEAKEPMVENALFWIASQSKPITATALMMLVDEGKVRLDEPVATYLPEFKDVWLTVEHGKDHMLLKQPEQPITIRHILSHTSGLPFKSALEQPTLDQLPLRVAVRSYAMTPFLFAPGSRYLYSNAGINTAGRVIEVVSGMPYAEFLSTRLFDPLGMRDTTFWPSGEQLLRLAKAYKPGPDKTGLVETPITQLTYPLHDRDTRYPMPAGGLFSTARDLARFCQMILNGGTFEGTRYLSESAVKEMTTRQTGKDLKESYGLGWAIGNGTFGHGGAYATNMTIDPQRGLITLWLVQQAGGFPGEGGKSQAAFRAAALEMFGKSPSAP